MATTGLFKYLAASKLAFFEKRLLLVTPPIYFNDPWDFRPKARIVSEAEIREIWRELEKESSGASVIAVPADFAQRERQNRLRMIRARLTSGDFRADQAENYQREIGKIVGIISLTDQPLSRVMWAHYAQSHTGFVIELAAGEQGEYQGFTIRGMGTGLIAAKVKYPPSFNEISLANDGSNVLEVTCSKHPCWEYEHEWRIIVSLKLITDSLNILPKVLVVSATGIRR